MGSGEVSLGLGIRAAFAVAYTAISGTPERREHAATQAAAVLFPFAMTLYLAAPVSLGVHLWRVALLLARVPAWFASLHRLFEARFGDAAIGVLPLALAGVAAGAAAFARSRWPEGEPARRPVFVSQLAVALGFATAAVPLQLEHEWVTVAWALEALALIALFVVSWAYQRFVRIADEEARQGGPPIRLRFRCYARAPAPRSSSTTCAPL